MGAQGRPPTPGWEEPFGDAPGFCGVAVCTDHGQVADLGSASSGAARGAQDLRSPLKGLGWLSQDLLHSLLGVGPGSFPGPWPGLWLGRPHVGESGFSPHRGGRGLPPRDVPSDLAVTWVPTPDVHTHSCLHTSTHSCTCTHSPTLQHTCSRPYTCTHLTFTPPPLSQAGPQTPPCSYPYHTLSPTLSHTFTRTHRLALSQGRTLAYTPTLTPPRSHPHIHTCPLTYIHLHTHTDVCSIHPHIHPYARSHPVTLAPPTPNVQALRFHIPRTLPHARTLTCNAHTRSLTHTEGRH